MEAERTGVDVIDRKRRGRPDGRAGRGRTSPADDPESGLLAQARRGDTRAYGRLVELYQDRIHGLITRLVRDPALAEELTQDVFIKAYRNLSSFRGDARFYTWVYRIAINVCHDQRASLAARVKEREDSLDDPALARPDPAASGTGPDEAVERDEVEAGFEASLNGLEPKYREAFLLRHQEGLNYQEIAQVLGISLSNAKVRVHRAREMVLQSLRSRGFDV